MSLRTSLVITSFANTAARTARYVRVHTKSGSPSCTPSGLLISYLRHTGPRNRAPSRIDHELDRSISSQRFGIRTSLVRRFHDLLRLAAVDAWKLGVQFHRQTVSALVVFQQAHQRAYG